MASTVTKAVVYNSDKTLFYRQEHEWGVLSPEMEAALKVGLEKQQKFLEDLKQKQNPNQTPPVTMHATITATGMPEISYSDFTFDMYQKAHHAWNQLTEELLRLSEKQFGPAGGGPGQIPPGQAPGGPGGGKPGGGKP